MPRKKGAKCITYVKGGSDLKLESYEQSCLKLQKSLEQLVPGKRFHVGEMPNCDTDQVTPQTWRVTKVYRWHFMAEHVKTEIRHSFIFADILTGRVSLC